MSTNVKCHFRNLLYFVFVHTVRVTNNTILALHVYSKIQLECSIIKQTFSQGTGFRPPRDLAKQPRLDVVGKHKNSAMLIECAM